jgi:hypothetical protein
MSDGMVTGPLAEFRRRVLRERVLRDAADEIERLRVEIERLTDTLWQMSKQEISAINFKTDLVTE